MWHRVGLVTTDVSEERVDSIFRVERISKLGTTLAVRSLILYFLKMEATRSSETSVLTRPTRRHIPEDGTLHSCRREEIIRDALCRRPFDRGGVGRSAALTSTQNSPAGPLAARKTGRSRRSSSSPATGPS
jgi:hypothetical protein